MADYLSRDRIIEALSDLSAELGLSGASHELIIAGGAVRTLALPQLLAMKLSAWRDDLDIGDARLLLSKTTGDREEIWTQIEPYLVPGRELKARYAFDDLWESGNANPRPDRSLDEL